MSEEHENQEMVKMNKDEDLMINYINLSNLKTQTLIEALLNFANAFDEPKQHLSELRLVHPVSDDSTGYFYIEYYTLDPSDLADRQDYVNAAKDEYISDKQESVFIDASPLHFAQIYNDPDNIDELSSVKTLVKNTISYLIEREKTQTVQDINFIDYINNDALHLPSIRIYSIDK